MSTQFDTMSTFQLASAARWQIGKLRQKSSGEGRFYYVTLNGVEMKASEARAKLIEHIKQKQAEAGLPPL